MILPQPPVHIRIRLSRNSQVYRHLLFNRLGREDSRFDVAAPAVLLPSTRLTKPPTALHTPLRSTSSPLRCLPNLGAHRKVRAVRTGATSLRHSHHLQLPAAATIPLLPATLLALNASLPPTNPAAVQLHTATCAAARPDPALPTPNTAVDRADRVLVHQAVPAAVDRVGVRPAVGGVGRVVGRHRQQRRRPRDPHGLRLRPRMLSRGRCGGVQGRRWVAAAGDGGARR